MNLPPFRIVLKKLNHINEIQAFVLGIALTLVVSFFYIRFFTTCPSPLFSGELKKEEQEIQKRIQETDRLLHKLSKTLETNKAVLNKMAVAEEPSPGN